MADFIYTTSKTIRRPWFIDTDKLEALDKLLDEEWLRLSARTEAQLSTNIEEKLKSDFSLELARMRKEHFNEEEVAQKRRTELRDQLKEFSLYTEERSITIYLKKNKKLPVKSFSDALREPILLEEIPIGFEARLKSGEITSSIKLIRGNGSLEITVSPEHISESKELFAAMQRWAIAARPPRWQQIWLLLNPGQWLIWLFLLWLPLAFLTDTKTAAANQYKAQAHQILKNGVTQDNQVKVVEIILALQSDYIPQHISQSAAYPGWYKLLFFGGFIVCVVLSITPKSMLGIGKGQEAINHWRSWMRIVFIIVPSFVFLNIVWPYISSSIFRSP
jgi:hypothetical protein